MSEEELYLFDLQGYLVVRDILTRQQVNELNEISDRVYPRDYADGDDSKGRKGIRNARYVSRWDPACQRLIDHPRIVPLLMELLGPARAGPCTVCRRSERIATTTTKTVRSERD